MPKVLIPDKLARGLLPTVKPLKTWVGHGNGRPCDGCGQPVTAPDWEYELEFADERIVRLHKNCFAVWNAATGN